MGVISISSASHWKFIFLVISFSTVVVAVVVMAVERDVSLLPTYYLAQVTCPADGGRSPEDEHLVTDLDTGYVCLTCAVIHLSAPRFHCR